MKNKEKKSGMLRQWAGVLLYMLIGGGCGVIVVRYMGHITGEGQRAGRNLILFLFLIPSVYLAILIQIVIHEAGHMIFGLLTGYRFSSFRIFNFMLLSEGGKLCMKRLSIAGTGGQCLMAPPDLKNGRLPVLLYNFGGAILNLITGILFFCLSMLVPETSFFSMFLLVLALTGVAFAVINGLPLRIGPVDNDGCNALSLMHSQAAQRAFWIQLKANDEVSRGTRLKDMPGEWFTVPEDDAMKNSIIASAGVLACSRLMDEHHFQEAERLMKHLLGIESGIADLYRFMMTCDRIYVKLISGSRGDDPESLLTKEQKKFMKAMKNYPSVLRTEYALALSAEKGEAKKVQKQFDKISKSYPYPCEIDGERELMRIAEECFEG